MAVYLDSILTEYYDGSAWVDISAYVVGDIKGNNGMGGWKPDQRVAALGTLNITLNNKGKNFSPMGGDAERGLSTLTGFNKGAKIRIRGLYNSAYYTIWSGWIASIDSDDKNWGNEQVRLMAVDWMNVPANYPMKGATIALNKRINNAMALILARLSVQPTATSFDTGSFIFPAVFDNVKRKTMALSELTKLANSELGYIYVKQDGTLRVENFLARQGWRALDQVFIASDVNSFLLMEDGFFLLLEDGGKIILDEGAFEDAALSTDAEGYNIFLGEDSLLNASIITSHPVVTDKSLKVLYSLGTPLFIPSGQTSAFSAHYTDPSGMAQASGTNMQTPVATTDYLANSAEDGTGTNQTANVVVTATYYGDTVYYSIANNASGSVYITFLRARGYGIYYGNSVESAVDDATSQAAFGYAPFQFDMRYQKDTYIADMYGLSVIEEYKNPKSRITKMNYLANLNKNHLMSFLVLSIGALILGLEDRSGISAHYYITDRDFTIKQGGIINVEYGVKQNDSYLSGGLLPVTVEFANAALYANGINFEYLPQVSNVTKKTICAWIYLTADPGGSKNYAVSSFGNVGDVGTNSSYSLGIGLSLAAGRPISFDIGVSGGTGGVRWDTVTDPAVSLNTWTHIAVSYDSTDVANNDPIIYKNGSVMAITQSGVSAGTIPSQIGNPLIVGAGFVGKIFDPRVYNRILTAAEVTALYNAGVPDETLVTDGLVFQGMSTYADNPLAAGRVLTSADRLVENIVRAVGVPHGAPIIRANP